MAGERYNVPVHLGHDLYLYAGGLDINDVSLLAGIVYAKTCVLTGRPAPRLVADSLIDYPPFVFDASIYRDRNLNILLY